MKKYRFFLYAVALWVVAPFCQAATIELPELGDPSVAYLSAKKEEQLKQEFLGWMYQYLGVVEEPEVVEYINALGYKLVAHSQRNAQAFQFFVVKDSSINAFAGPGGVIGVNSGLIEATRDESELAAVLAHEIAHITQRHLARTYASVSRSALPTTAAILAAVILGSQSPEAGQAVMTAAIAGGIQGQINFTRENEKEADAIGIGLMAEAGFDARGMSSFFERLKRKSELSDFNLPELLRTHPLPVSRIAQARARISQLKIDDTASAAATDYAFFKERVIGLQHAEDESIEQDFPEPPALADEEFVKEAVYAEVLRLNRQGRYKEASQRISELLKQEPLNIFYQLAYVNAWWGMEEYAVADEWLVHYRNENPESRVLTFYYARSRYLLQKPDEALDILNSAIRDSDELYFYPLLAQVKGAVGDVIGAHEVLSDYFLRKGLTSGAIEQLTIAVQKSDDPVEKARLEQRLHDLRKKFAVKANG